MGDPPIKIRMMCDLIRRLPRKWDHTDFTRKNWDWMLSNWGKVTMKHGSFTREKRWCHKWTGDWTRGKTCESSTDQRLALRNPNWLNWMVKTEDDRPQSALKHWSMCLTHKKNIIYKKNKYMLYMVKRKNELMVPSHSNISTLWLFSIAMENGPFIDDKHDDLPEMVIYQKWWFSIANRSITRW